METWYKTDYGISIKAVDVTRSTESSVWTHSEWKKRDVRSNIATDYERYHRTKEDAVRFLLHRETQKAEQHEAAALSARNKIAELMRF